MKSQGFKPFRDPPHPRLNGGVGVPARVMVRDWSNKMILLGWARSWSEVFG